eukprot:5933458-Pyramimonas_sp.AAC.1
MCFHHHWTSSDRWCTPGFRGAAWLDGVFTGISNPMGMGWGRCKRSARVKGVATPCIEIGR